MPASTRRRDASSATARMDAVLSGVRDRLQQVWPGASRPGTGLPDGVLDLLSDPVVVVDAQDAICAANQAARDRFGLSPGGTQAGLAEAVLAPDHREGYRVQLKRTLDDGDGPAEDRVAIRADGSEARVPLRIQRLEGAEPPRFAVLLPDPQPASAEAPDAFAEIEARRRTLHVVLDALPDPVVAVDRTGRVLFRNQASLREISRGDGATPDALPGGQWAAADAAMRAGSPSVGEDAASDGIRLTTRIPVRGRTGDVVGLVAISRDVTAQKADQARLLDAARAAEAAARAGGEVLATTSHEVRTLMSGVTGMTALLLDTELDADQRDFVETIRSSSATLLRVVNDVLDLSKLDAGMLEIEHRPYALRQTVEAALAIVAQQARAKGLVLSGTVDAAVPGTVVGDALRIQQVLANLLTNAVKFTEAGAVQVGVERVSGDVPALAFSVRDTGVGIDPERLDAVFEPFAQADASTARTHGGTGLGLTICRRLVSLMGGELTAESVPGGGSVFQFTVALETPSDTWVPLADLAAASPAEASAETGASETGAPQAGATEAGAPEAGATEAGATEAGATEAGATEAGATEPAETAGDERDAPALPEPPPEAGDETVLMDIDLGAIEVKPPDAAPDPVAETLSLDELATDGPRRSKMMDAGSILPSARVLLVEDDPIMQKVTRMTLQRLGYRPTVVDNGRKGVLAVRANPFDVVLMDIMMPVMDGLEATRQIRADPGPHPSPVIVMLTANAMKGDREAGVAAGCDAYLTKPVAAQDLAATIERAIREQQSPEPEAA